MNNTQQNIPDTAIGIMSGTSVDGIDAALIQFPGHNPPVVLDCESAAFPDQLAAEIIALTQPGRDEIDRAGRVHVALGHRYAQVANALVQRNTTTTIHVIGCHGQTVRHRPTGDYPFTLQLGSGAVISQQTGITTVTDFRSADMALGGQGAPFAPFFHHAFFRSDSHYRAIINLGGIANITLLPDDASKPVIGFDSGPANGLMDAWIQRHRNLPYDENGSWAAEGTIQEDLLDTLMAHPFLKQSPPKSTGREDFHIGWLDQVLATHRPDISAVDVQRTLSMFTCRSIASQLPHGLDEIYLCGGGAENRFLVELLAAQSGVDVYHTGRLGIPPRWVETSAFGWMALQTLQQQPCTLPSVTGASRHTVCGSVYY